MVALKTRVWSAGKLIVLAAALVAIYLLFAAAAMRVALKLGEVTVPDLRGRTVNDASRLLSDAGLTLKVNENQRVVPAIAAGRIAFQEPPAGAPARRQRGIRVWLSSGPRIMLVPQLAGETERTAQLRLQQEGLTVGTLSEIRSSDYPAGVVVAQEPPPESRGTRVSLLVNRGERGATYVMPDLIGVNGDRAADILRAQGLRVAVVGDHPYPGVPPGIVLRQFPPAGFQIAPAEPVSLEVSR